MLAFSALMIGMAPLVADDLPDPAGRPEKFKAGMKAACAIYYEDGAWHMRMTAGGAKKKKKAVISGSARVKGDWIRGDFQGLDKAEKAKDADWIVIHKDKLGFDFQFGLHGKVDAVNFKVGPKAETVTFQVMVDGDDNPKAVLIGKAGAHPEKGGKLVFPAAPGGTSSSKPADKE
jgi:hypothetical protein